MFDERKAKESVAKIFGTTSPAFWELLAEDVKRTIARGTKQICDKLESLIVQLPNEHMFRPEVRVTDEGIAIDVNRSVILKLKNVSNHPCFFNINRPVSQDEYGVIPPMSCFVITRKADKVYLKAPLGQECVVKVDALVMS